MNNKGIDYINFLGILKNNKEIHFGTKEDITNFRRDQ